MHLRDSEGGGAAYVSVPSQIEDSVEIDAEINHSTDPSSTRTICLNSNESRPSNSSLLLAWVLVLSRDNDDRLGVVNWGYGNNSGETTLSLDIRNVPFTKNDPLSVAFEAFRDVDEAENVEEGKAQRTMFFNDGLVESHNSTFKATQRRPHHWSYQIEVSVSEHELVFRAQWDRKALSHRLASTRLDSYVEILNTITKDSAQLVSDAIGPTRTDLNQLWDWNAEMPPLIERSMHEFVAENAAAQPDARAIESWDGNFTYAEVEDLSTQLALHLVSLGAAVGEIIPLCFEKSRWTVVALLAVIKAGCAFALTDPSQPEARLRTIVEQTSARFVVSSELQAPLAQRIAGQATTLTLAKQIFAQIKTTADVVLPQFPKSLPLYIQFTSGSTGKPKGVICSHANYTSGAVPRADSVGYRAHSRVFDFASYAFDVSIDCMLCTLANGGCLCIPSDEDRMNDLSGAIRKTQCNMAHMTPSVARVLDADIIPSLEVLGLGGEAVSAGDAAAWSQATKVIIAYGPSECTVGCTVNSDVRVSTNIGKGVGGLTWIVDPDDHDRLMPVGAVGELLVEGPVVGLGYLNDPEKTAEVFIEDPTWLLAGCGSVPGRHGQLYKTGDLVRYDADGTGAIAFVGRKDQQVKLRGQRIELAEVEYHLRGKLPSSVKVVAEVIKPGGGEPALVAFLVEKTTPDGETNEGDFATLSPDLSKILSQLDAALGVDIPRYMVPSSYIPLHQMPALVSGKVDRKRLRELGSSMSREDVAGMRASSHESSEPETEIEIALQRSWKRTLASVAGIGRNDSFFALGGDSLRAMRLVAAARDEGISLTVASVFNYPMLKDMASKATVLSDQPLEAVQPFSLLGNGWSVEKASEDVAKLCGIEEQAVEDVYPCTPLQEGLMALSAKVKEAYVAQRVVELSDTETAKKLQSAFNIATADSPILRTRIVQIPGEGLVQVVVRGDAAWYEGNNLQEYLSRDRDDPMELGKPLVRYALIADPATEKAFFVLTMHHALYDGWSMPLIVERVNKAYEGERMQRPADFKNFIQYLNCTAPDEAQKFWKEKLRGANGRQFPSLPWPGYQTQADSLLEIQVSLPGRPASNTTIATLIRGAWAYVASQYSASSDVVFGETLTGRNAPIKGAEEVEGPMITTVPLRVQIDEDISASDYLQGIHDQTVEQIPYEHTGLQHIRRVSPDAYEACELRTGLVLHPSADGEEGVAHDYPANRLVPAGDSEAAQEALKFNTYALMLVCSIEESGFHVMASFDSNTVDKTTMHNALNRFAQVAKQLCSMTEASIAELPQMTDDEEAELSRLSTANLESVAKTYPEAQALWVVDPVNHGKLSPLGAYGELIVSSTRELSLPTIEALSWMPATPDHGVSALYYKTGRIAKMTSDGAVYIAKVDSKASASAVQAPVKRISAASTKQRKLRSLWSRVLKLSEQNIGLNDIFFRLGGDSISAMKLVSESRLDGLVLTVAQIFKHRSLYEMANVLTESTPAASSEHDTPVLKPFELLGVEDKESFITHTIQPLLADQSWKVVNVIPTRPLQDVAIKGTTDLPRYSARYEAMYMDGNVDRTQLFKACSDLVSRNEVLRTVFVENQGKNLGVVLEKVEPAIVEYDIDGDVELFVKLLCNLDVQTKMPLGSCFVKWFFVQSSNGSSALVFRISHAQYDEICLPLMLRQLSALHEGKPVPEALPFSSFVGHLIKSNVPQSIDYWRELLQGSSLSVLKPDTPVTKRNHFAIHKEFDISSRSKDVTIATLPTAAWALCLARRLEIRDVTFGEVVSGRNIDFPNADAVVGPCWQYVPVRVKFEQGWTVTDLLGYVQNQHIASSAHEGIGLPEVVKNCTDWPENTDWFDSVVHQDVEHVESLGFSSASSRMETIYPHSEPLREWKIQAFPAGDKLIIEVVTFESWAEHAEALLRDVGEALETLVRQPGALLFE